MKFILDLLGLLAFSTRALRAQAERQAFARGIVCFSAGFIIFGITRNAVYSALPDFADHAQPVGSLLSLNLIPALLFVSMVYIPAVIVLSNSISGVGLGFAVSAQEYRAHASVLLPLWGMLFLIDSPLQYYVPQFLVIQQFGISIPMLVLLLMLLTYTGWAIKQLNYLTGGQALGAFALSWFTVPIYYLFASFLNLLPFFLMIPLLYIGYQWIQGLTAARTNERSFQKHLHVLTLNPQDADAHYQLGLVHLKKGDIDVARRYFESAAGIDPGSPEYHYQLGRACELGQDWAKALDEYEETYRLNPEFGLGDIFREVGKAYLHTGNVEKGIEFLRYFLARRGSDPEGRYWLAVALGKSGEAEQMCIQLNMILDHARSNPRFFRKENREWIYKARTLARDSKSAN